MRIAIFALALLAGGSDKRRWFRVAPKELVPRAGRLLLGPNTQPIECKIVDLSAGGAQLELHSAL